MRLLSRLVFLALACAPGNGARQAARPLVDTSRVVLDSMPGSSITVYTTAALDEAPATIRCASPAYPDTLRRLGVQGRVMLELVIDTLGHPETGSVRTLSSPHDSLSSLAIHAMQACEFTPARVRGRAVRVLVQIPIDFKINAP